MKTARLGSLALVGVCLFAVGSACEDAKPLREEKLGGGGPAPAPAPAPGQPSMPQSGALPANHPPVGSGGAMAPAGASAGPATTLVTGTVRLDPKLASKMPQSATLFLMARPSAQGGAPLVAKRVHPVTLPLSFQLTSEDSMIPAEQMPAQLFLQARLDQDGDAISRTPGDVAGSLASPVAIGATGIELELTQVLTESRPSQPVTGSPAP